MGDPLERERSVPMENVEEVKKKSKGKKSRYGKWYGLEFELRCVKLRLEEGLPVSLLSEEIGAKLHLVRNDNFLNRDLGPIFLLTNPEEKGCNSDIEILLGT
jgi:hypothetical protein